MEQLERGKDIPRDMIEASMKDLNSLEGLVDGINEGIDK